MNETQLYDKIYKLKEQVGQLIADYWHLYSGMDTWYFWFNLATLLIPLIILFFKIDRSRIFEIAFFGYSAHVLWANTDTILSSHNYLNHVHSLTYLLPVGITVTDVLIPVVFMLVYQYCTNQGKNFYLYVTFASIIMAFGFGYFTEATGLIKMHKGMNCFYLFLIDVAVAFIAYWVTILFRILGTKH